MKVDLPKYLNKYKNDDITLRTVEGIVVYNKENSFKRILYGHPFFEGITALEHNLEEHYQLRTRSHGEVCVIL